MRRITWTLACILLAAQAAPNLAADPSEVDGSAKNHPPMVIKVEGLPEEVVPLAGGAREITFSFMAKDANGWEDISRAEVALYAPDNITHMRAANVTAVRGGEGASQWFNATFTMWYYELPTQGENYTLHMRVLDKHGAWSEPRMAEFEYAELAAISITTTGSPDAGGANATDEQTLDQTNGSSTGPAVGFGDNDPGSESDTTDLTVENTGNVVVDLELYGTDLIHPEGFTIPVSAIRYTMDTLLADETPLSTTPQILDIDLAPGSDSSARLHWKMQVPSGDAQYVPAGTYAGSITVSAVES